MPAYIFVKIWDAYERKIKEKKKLKMGDKWEQPMWMNASHYRSGRF